MKRNHPTLTEKVEGLQRKVGRRSEQLHFSTANPKKKKKTPSAQKRNLYAHPRGKKTGGQKESDRRLSRKRFFNASKGGGGRARTLRRGLLRLRKKQERGGLRGEGKGRRQHLELKKHRSDPPAGGPKERWPQESFVMTKRYSYKRLERKLGGERPCMATSQRISGERVSSEDLFFFSLGGKGKAGSHLEGERKKRGGHIVLRGWSRRHPRLPNCAPSKIRRSSSSKKSCYAEPTPLPNQDKEREDHQNASRKGNEPS